MKELFVFNFITIKDGVFIKKNLKLALIFGRQMRGGEMAVFFYVQIGQSDSDSTT